jgi:hypothetical protein
MRLPNISAIKTRVVWGNGVNLLKIRFVVQGVLAAVFLFGFPLCASSHKAKSVSYSLQCGAVAESGGISASSSYGCLSQLRAHGVAVTGTASNLYSIVPVAGGSGTSSAVTDWKRY